MRTLIVDDTPDNVQLLEAHLRNAGLKDVLKASNARAAYEILGIPGGAAAAVDLILMDFMMPEISGTEACRAIKAVPAYQDVPVIMVTARTDSESLDEAFRCGAMDYIIKPVRKTEFLARVRSALDLKQERDSRKQRESELRQRNEELEKAMREIKTLRGFIPICSHCKKIRNVQGMWQQLEAYLTEHSDAKLSHGLCETCLQVHYPEFYKQKNNPPAS